MAVECLFSKRIHTPWASLDPRLIFITTNLNRINYHFPLDWSFGSVHSVLFWRWYDIAKRNCCSFCLCTAVFGKLSREYQANQHDRSIVSQQMNERGISSMYTIRKRIIIETFQIDKNRRGYFQIYNLICGTFFFSLSIPIICVWVCVWMWPLSMALRLLASSVFFVQFAVWSWVVNIFNYHEMDSRHSWISIQEPGLSRSFSLSLSGIGSRQCQLSVKHDECILWPDKT